ncbi:hypothetical protein CFOL_v3_26753 [Cephalotus follicularis]|uniref:MULE transposase domain-containing protein n=1 Tax=Cephalotus follicularis TaxID=3775 RepID=A0A1Q3CT04_CEPFO|nr:hypothetical protein CFOL_v3_26753 [Cephalotus follicularis]
MYRAKQISLDEINHARCYSSLTQYARLIRLSSPGTFVKIELNERNDESQLLVFKRIFVCFPAMKIGFLKGCMPYLGLDGCHLKGPYGGVPLLAVSCDGNNCLFYVAYATVEVENKSCWRFYLHLCLGEGIHNTPLVIMSDQTKVPIWENF